VGKEGFVPIVSNESGLTLVPLPQIEQNGLISGGVVQWTGSGYNFNISGAVYRIAGTLYNSDPTLLTLSTPDPTNDRIDVFAVDTNGDVVIIAGTPAASPVKPQVNPLTQLELTSVIVTAASTSPTLTEDIIYDQNTEWVGTSSGTGTANFASTNNPFQGSVSLETTNIQNNFAVVWTRGSDLTISNYLTLGLQIRLKASMGASQNIRIEFLDNSNNPVSTAQNLALDKSLSGSYQFIGIALSTFTFTSSTVRKIRFTFLRASGTVTYSGYNMDVVKLEGGINPPITVNTFLGLQDTPKTYLGQSGKVVAVKSDETGLEFITGGGGGSLPSGGATGQVLTKLSAADGDADWQDIPAVNGGNEPTVKTTASADQSLPSGVLTILDYDSTLNNNATSVYTVGTDGRITVSEEGVYDITAGVVIEANAVTALESAFFGIFRNGNLIAIQSINTTLAAASSNGLTCSTQVFLAGGDIIDCRALVNSVGGLAPGLARRLGVIVGANATQVNSLAIVKCVATSHDAVTIGSPANGLSITGAQVLSLGLASAGVTGALSGADWSTFNGKIAGTIASGQIAFGTALDTIGGSNNLWWDSANSRVGILTNSPTNSLDVNGTTRIRTISNLGSTATRFLVASATGVISERTGAELITDLGISGGSNWTIVGSDIYRNSNVAIGRTTIPSNGTGSYTFSVKSKVTGAGGDVEYFLLENSAGVAGFIGQESGLMQINPTGASTGLLTVGNITGFSGSRGVLIRPSSAGASIITTDTDGTTGRFRIDNNGSFWVNGLVSFGTAIGTTVNAWGTGIRGFGNNVAARKSLIVQRSTGTEDFYVASNGEIGFFDGGVMVFGTVTGMKLGTATSQKIGFWNATPIVQPTTGVAAATLASNAGTTLTSTDTFDGYTLQQVVRALRNTGLLA
jgi:hypothetical protein